MPGCEVTFAEDAGPDKRSYRVNCDKIRRVMPAFQAAMGCAEGRAVAL